MIVAFDPIQIALGLHVGLNRVINAAEWIKGCL